MLNYVKLFKSCTTTLFRNFAEITQTKKSQRLNLIELFGVSSFFFSKIIQTTAFDLVRNPRGSPPEYTQSQSHWPVPWRHEQSCTFRPLSVQGGTYCLCDDGHMRNVTQTSVYLVRPCLISPVDADLCRWFENLWQKSCVQTDPRVYDLVNDQDPI